jgi:hypothetical protein
MLLYCSQRKAAMAKHFLTVSSLTLRNRAIGAKPKPLLRQFKEHKEFLLGISKIEKCSPSSAGLDFAKYSAKVSPRFASA